MLVFNTYMKKKVCIPSFQKVDAQTLTALQDVCVMFYEEIS